MSDPQSTPSAQESVRTEGSTDALPIAPALGLTLDAARMPRKSTLVDKRVLLITALAVLLAFVAALASRSCSPR